jgi:hypothetical protein
MLVLLLSLNIVFNTDCGDSRIVRESVPIDQLNMDQSKQMQNTIKLYMKSGELYQLEKWNMNSTRDTFAGYGRLFDSKRDLISEGNFLIPTGKVILAETNYIKPASIGTALSVLTVISGITTVICITNPKACYGSCPTFYAFDGDNYMVQAEGFPASILPSLEEKDIDALYRIKCRDENFEIQVKNEAYETHIIRSADILALPKPFGGRVFCTKDGKFLQAINLTEPAQSTASEGDISEKLCAFDGNERFSTAESNDLSAREIIEITFHKEYSDNPGLVIASRQTLLTKFLFYQTLTYLGSNAVDFF